MSSDCCRAANLGFALGNYMGLYAASCDDHGLVASNKQELVEAFAELAIDLEPPEIPEAPAGPEEIAQRATDIRSFRNRVFENITVRHGPKAGDIVEYVSACIMFSITGGMASEVRAHVEGLADRIGLPALRVRKHLDALQEGNDLVAEWFNWVLSELAKPLVFVSHSAADEPLAAELAERLEDAGIKAFLSRRDIEPGARWNDQIREKIHEAAEILLVASPHAAASHWVMMEVGAAWALNKKVTPVLTSEDAAALPDYVREFQAQHFVAGGGCEKLLKTLKGRLLTSR